MTPTRSSLTPLPARLEKARRDRQRQVEQVLLDHGLIDGPRRVVAPSQPEREDRVRRLRDALEALGPLFTAFGRYLSTRADLFRAKECLILAALPDSAGVEPAATVRGRLEHELGRPIEEVFEAFVYEPLACRLLQQTHRAILAGGQDVLVHIVHTQHEAAWEDDLALLPLLARALGQADDPALGEAVADFTRSLRARLDCRQRAESLEFLAHEAKESDLLAVPRVFHEASSARILTVERLHGITLRELADEPGGTAVDVRRRRAARRLSHVWLQTTLASRTLPVEFESIELAGDGRVGIVGGSFTALPTASRLNLWNYLRAAAAHYPERAATYLFHELTGAGPLATERELQLRLRQAMPFRDGGWTATADTLGEHLLLHWKIARECGFVIPGYLKDFYRGLFEVARLGRRLDPAGDPLAEGLEGLNWQAGWTELRHLTSPGELGSSLSSNVLALLELPQRIERVLRTAARHREQPPDSATVRAARRRAWNRSTAVATLLVLMTAVTLLATRLPLPAGAWAERVAALLFLSLGAALLRTAWSTR